jgi:uroporphyrinogen-III decarboxylase
VNSRQRLLTALDGGQPDRLPVTTHHLMPYFLETYLDGCSEDEFFDRFELDPIKWVYDLRPDASRGEYWSSDVDEPAPAGARWIVSDDWRIETPELSAPSGATRYEIVTPRGTLSMALQYGPQTDWVVERPIKQKTQIELFERYAPVPLCDVEAIDRQAEKVRERGRGILRGAVPGFEIYGQPGCWQDAAELFGIEKLIMETFDDPGWVREFLGVLRDRKLKSIASMEGARFDLVELGGGAASSTVISPDIFAEFVAPYDSELIDEAHRVGQRVVYHTCGGMMPLLEMIADMGPDAMETFTPPALGGDADLEAAKARIGDRVCMIGGFDQHTHFKGCSPAETRRAVRDCFEAAGEGGGYILAPSDHFFDADVDLIRAFAEEARSCRYAGVSQAGGQGLL